MKYPPPAPAAAQETANGLLLFLCPETAHRAQKQGGSHLAAALWRRIV